MERCCDPRNSTTSAITCRGYKLLECSRAIFVVSTRLSSTVYYLLTTRTIFDRVLIDPFDLCPVCSLQVSYSSIVLVAASGRRQCVFRLRPSAIPRPPIQGHNCIQHHVPQSSSHLVHQSSAFAHNTDYIYIQFFYTTDPCRAVKREGYTSQSPIYRNALMPLRPSQILPKMLALPEKQFHHLKSFFCHPICVRVQMICARSLPYRFYEFLTTPTLAGCDDC